MAYVAGIRNLQSVSHRRSDEMKRVAPHIHISDRLLDFGHVASDALATLAAYFVMCVLLNRRRVRAIRRIRAVTIEA